MAKNNKLQPYDFVKPENMERYMKQQPTGDIFEQHKERSEARTVAGMGRTIFVYGRGRKWLSFFNVRRHWQKRLEDLIATYGEAIHGSQWEFADRVECGAETNEQRRARKLAERERLIAELGFGQYQKLRAEGKVE